MVGRPRLGPKNLKSNKYKHFPQHKDTNTGQETYWFSQEPEKNQLLPELESTDKNAETWLWRVRATKAKERQFPQEELIHQTLSDTGGCW